MKNKQLLSILENLTPTIIQTIKDYNFALIRHLWENGEIE